MQAIIDHIFTNIQEEKTMASKEVKLREKAGENLDGLLWAPEKPFMLVRGSGGKVVVSFFFSKADFDFAVSKAVKDGDEILNAAEVTAFRKIGDYKSGFGRNTEIPFI